MGLGFRGSGLKEFIFVAKVGSMCRQYGPWPEPVWMHSRVLTGLLLRNFKYSRYSMGKKSNFGVSLS